MKLLTENNQNYEIWNLEIPEISPRTILYNLPPVKIGTPEVESLSGYISRLAQEHRLSPVVLLKNSVRELSELPKTILQNSISAAFAGGLNGFGESTEVVINILQKATQRKDIFLTSLMPWKYKLSKHKLLKKNLAWCPICFSEQQEKGLVYEKLIWNLYHINACHVHNLPLTEQCPHCNKKLKVLSGKSRPGFCSMCRCWLGSNLVAFDEFRNFRDPIEKKNEIWKAVRFGEFLSGTPFSFIQTPKDEKSPFVENLYRIIKEISHGSINDFSHITGIWHVNIRRLLTGEVLPTKEMILKLSLALKVSPIKLFVDHSLDIVENTASKLPPKKLLKEEMRTHLKIFLQEHPPPSANEISRRSGWTTIRMQRHFPLDYKNVVDRYTEYVKKKIPDLPEREIKSILLKASREKPPPSLQSVFRKIGCRDTGGRYYQRFPELCRKIANRYKRSKLKKFNAPRAKKIIQATLDESPPPSFSEVARRIGCTRENLSKKLPELSAALNQRYKSHLIILRLENIQQLHYEVRNAVKKLQNKNTIISMNKVRKMLPRKWNDKNFKNAYRMILKDLNLNGEK